MTHEFYEGIQPLKIVLSGQKLFGLETLKLCERQGVNILAVCVPLDDKYLLPYAREAGYKIIPGGSLTADVMPDNCDLGICAHSFDYVGRLTRYRAKLGWIGYHPSLLPRHRGRSSIEWALRMKDIITGGTVFWLNSGIDRGDIAYQDWIWLDHSKDARYIWREELLPMGLRLFKTALTDIKNNIIKRTPQRGLSKFSTFEPGLENIRDIYRPDLLMLGN
jgi:methionyl-tRNA formyltransferase